MDFSFFFYGPEVTFFSSRCRRQEHNGVFDICRCSRGEFGQGWTEVFRFFSNLFKVKGRRSFLLKTSRVV